MSYPVLSVLQVNWTDLDEVVAYADYMSDETSRQYTVYRVTSNGAITIYSLGLTSNEQRDVLHMRNKHGARLTVVWRKNGDHTTQPAMPDRYYYASYPLSHIVKRAIRRVRAKGFELASVDRRGGGRLYYYLYGRKDIYGVVEHGSFWITTVENHRHFVGLLQEESRLRQVVVGGARPRQAV